MPKIKCLCNFIILLGDIPSVNQLNIISDVEFFKFFENDNCNVGEIYHAMKIVVKCPNCGRLHVFWDGYDKPQRIYKLEE